MGELTALKAILKALAGAGEHFQFHPAAWWQLSRLFQWTQNDVGFALVVFTIGCLLVAVFYAVKTRSIQGEGEPKPSELAPTQFHVIWPAIFVFSLVLVAVLVRKSASNDNMEKPDVTSREQPEISKTFQTPGVRETPDFARRYVPLKSSAKPITALTIKSCLDLTDLRHLDTIEVWVPPSAGDSVALHECPPMETCRGRALAPGMHRLTFAERVNLPGNICWIKVRNITKGDESNADEYLDPIGLTISIISGAR